MMMFIRLAWRNTWRNPRRTLITAASVFFAMLLALLMRSLQLGIYDSMIHNSAGIYVGYVQIHRKGYWSHKNLDYTFRPEPALNRILSSNHSITRVVPRLESYALVSSGLHTRVALVIGTDPVREQGFTGLNRKLIQGSYFRGNAPQVLVGKGLANQLRLKPLDTLILLGQGYHGAIAAGKYEVRGIFRLGSPQLDGSLVYLPLPSAQALFQTGNRLSSLSLDLNQPARAGPISRQLQASLDSTRWEVMDWQEMMPQVFQLIQVDNAGGIIIIGILYLIIAFGVFGTILMMLAERRHEMGILSAIGMKPLKMGWMTFLELVIMILLGILAGLGVSVPLIDYLFYHPIPISGKAAQAYQQFGLQAVMPFSRDPGIFLSQMLTVFALCLILSLYAWWKVYRVEARINLKD